jgi:hypothetical protein
MSDNGGKPWRERLADLSVKTLAGIIGGVITAVLAAILIAHFVGSNSTSPAISQPTTSTSTPSNQFTIEDFRYHGTWALSAPTSTTLLPRNHRPPNAREWLPEFTKVTITCAQPGATYGVIFRGKHQRWRWWAHLTDGAWVAMATFKETVVDGPQGFETC